MHYLSVLGTHPVLFFRSIRAYAKLTELSDDAAKAIRFTRIFSSTKEFYGIAKLRKISFTDGSKSIAANIWKIVQRVKKFVSSIAWFCKVSHDAGYFSESALVLSRSIKMIQLPYDSIALSTSIVKATKVTISWIHLIKKVDKAPEEIEQMHKLETKAVRRLLHCSSKAFDISYRILEMVEHALPRLVIANLVASALIKSVTLGYTIYNDQSMGRSK
ncbi:MAG: hypothetical protein LLF94_11755 [Chlamydiales bacterium]|nr:hypothetical protein [Chlamydiales bacterium]